MAVPGRGFVIKIVFLTFLFSSHIMKPSQGYTLSKKAHAKFLKGGRRMIIIW